MTRWTNVARHTLPASAVIAFAALQFGPANTAYYRLGYVVGSLTLVVGAAVLVGLLVALYVEPVARRRTAPITVFVTMLWILTASYALALCLSRLNSEDTSLALVAPNRVPNGATESREGVSPDQATQARERLQAEAARNTQALGDFERQHPDWSGTVTASDYLDWRRSLPKGHPCRSSIGLGPMRFDAIELAAVSACLDVFADTQAQRANGRAR